MEDTVLGSRSWAGGVGALGVGRAVSWGPHEPMASCPQRLGSGARLFGTFFGQEEGREPHPRKVRARPRGVALPAPGPRAPGPGRRLSGSRPVGVAGRRPPALCWAACVLPPPRRGPSAFLTVSIFKKPGPAKRGVGVGSPVLRFIKRNTKAKIHKSEAPAIALWVKCRGTDFKDGTVSFGDTH